MITVSDVPFNISQIVNEYPEGSIEYQLLDAMSASSETHSYESSNALKFELNLRKEIARAAMDLNHSRLSFSVFAEARCNPKFWEKTEEGGFMLKEGVEPGEAINDIFVNTHKYATECSTAIMIIYCKALLEALGSNLFNEYFSNIYLMDWKTAAVLKYVITAHNVSPLLIGDGGYFSNPDYNPEKPEWQGENVIALPDSMFYGHGLGIATADEIINSLNRLRSEDATRSAYLTNVVNRLNAKKIYAIYNGSAPSPAASPAPIVWRAFPRSFARG